MKKSRINSIKLALTEKRTSIAGNNLVPRAMHVRGLGLVLALAVLTREQALPRVGDEAENSLSQLVRRFLSKASQFNIIPDISF